MNGIVCMYDTVLPEHFVFAHTTGTMLGKATYGDYFVALHNVTVGTDHGMQPRFGQGAVLFAGSSVIGDCTIGASVSVAAGALILNTSIPSEHVVAGTSPDLIVKPAKRRVIEEFFHMASSERLVMDTPVSG